MRLHGLLVATVLVLAGCLTTAPDTSLMPAEDAAIRSEPTFVPAGNVSDGLPPYQPLPTKMQKLSLKASGDAPGGVRIKLWNNRAYVTTGAAQDGLAIFDITDPFEPERLGSVKGIGPREGLAILNYGHRLVAAVSVGGFQSSEMVFVDVTDPAAPKELRRLPITSHTLAAFSSAHVVYNAGWPTGGAGGTEIIDARNPDDIKIHKKWNWGARAVDGTPLQPTVCHDIVVDQEKARAYCAAQGQTTIWDLKDPLEPVVLTAVTNPAAPHHNTAFPILGGRVLVIGVELAGCGPPAAGTKTPTGLWFFDLRASPPTPLSWLSLPSEQPGVYGFCAPHFGSEVGNGTGFLSFGWFLEGILLIDASDPANPNIAHRSDQGGEASDAMHYRGLVFAAARKGGLQVAVPE